MNAEELKKNTTKVIGFILDKKLSKAFESLEKIVEITKKEEFRNLFDKQKETYLMMLKYSFSGIEDPLRNELFTKIQRKLIELTDAAEQDILSGNSLNKVIIEKKIFEKQLNRERIELPALLEQLTAEELYHDNENRKSIIQKIFYFLWFTDKYTDNHLESINKAIQGKSVYSHEKSLITSAVTISLLRFFDQKKFTLLFDIYESGSEYVWQRAIVGLVFSLYIFDNRILLYPEICNRAEKLRLDDDIEQNMETIVLQLVRSRETKSISERLFNEIAPEIDKFKSIINEKLDLDQIIQDNISEDKNPDWEELFDDAPNLFNKMAEFSQMQMDGSDVFMSAFSGLKNFDFFKSPQNWFLPFYKENSDLSELFTAKNAENEQIDTFLEALEKSSIMCNSDKYSFCLNLKMLATSQKKMILDLYKMELDSTNEDSYEDKILNKKTDVRKIFTNYIQDYYRFMKLHSWKNDFEDFFETKMDIHNTNFYKQIIKDTKTLSKIANLYFKNKFYQDAIETYTLLDIPGENKALIYEKLGFCHQKINNFKEAVTYYLRAELLDRESVWIFKKTAFCYGKLGEYEKALTYYQKADELKPDDLHILANIGQCHIYLENYEEALKVYYKIEYLDGNNAKAMKPIAWCSFFLGKFDDAKNYLNKLLKISNSYFDYISLGNIFFCENNKKDALISYKEALNISGKEKFIQAIEDDKDILFKHGVNVNDYMLLLDFIELQ